MDISLPTPMLFYTTDYECNAASGRTCAKYTVSSHSVSVRMRDLRIFR